MENKIMGESRRRKLAGLGPRQPKIPQPSQRQIDVSNREPLTCECGCIDFQMVTRLYHISAIESPTGQETIAQQPAFICVECKRSFKLVNQDKPNAQ